MNCNLPEPLIVLSRAGAGIHLLPGGWRWEYLGDSSVGTLLCAGVQCPGGSSPPCWAQSLDRARKAPKRGTAVWKGCPVGADIPLVTGVGVFICGCCPGHWHLSPLGQSLAAVAVQGGKQSLFYRQEEALAHLQRREIFNFKARSYFLFKIQTDRDGC